VTVNAWLLSSGMNVSVLGEFGLLFSALSLPPPPPQAASNRPQSRGIDLMNLGLRMFESLSDDLVLDCWRSCTVCRQYRFVIESEIRF
jgi:hypothetical protein